MSSFEKKSDNNIYYISSSDSDENGDYDTFEETYTLIGVAEKFLYKKNDGYWWTVKVDDMEEIKKINISTMKSFSGLFQYSNLDNTIYCDYPYKVLIQVTFNNDKRCVYEKNKIIKFIEKIDEYSL